MQRVTRINILSSNSTTTNQILSIPLHNLKISDPHDHIGLFIINFKYDHTALLKVALHLHLIGN